MYIRILEDPNYITYEYQVLVKAVHVNVED